MHTVRPLRLPPNQLHRFYRGGARIAGLRGSSDSDERAPEDWVGSVTTTFGSSEQGLSRLEDGRILAEAVAEDPEGFLGPGRGADPALLVKLLDAGERLPVHFHPDRRFARERLGSPYGKSEAWIVVEAEGDDPGGPSGPARRRRHRTRWRAGSRGRRSPRCSTPSTGCR